MVVFLLVIEVIDSSASLFKPEAGDLLLGAMHLWHLALPLLKGR
jgi:hypothetical protein